MNINTAITTAARRLTRESNTRPAEVTTAYDADGNPVEAWSSGMYHTGGTAPACAVTLAGTKLDRLTYRRAQDLLDAAAWAAAHPEQHATTDPIGDYLYRLAVAREVLA